MVKQGGLHEKVKDFLDLFEGDPLAAVYAIRDYSRHDTHKQQVKKTKPVPKTPVVIKTNHLEKTYKIGKHEIRALQDVSIEIHEGEFVALTGTSGSGKSTLLQHIGGLDTPTSGDIIVHNVSLSDMRDSELSKFRNKTIGFVFQLFYLQPFLTLLQNIAIPGMFSHQDRRKRNVRAQRLLRLVGLEDRMHHLPKDISGGQMQRAAIARALLNNPKIILADEPTGNLDSSNTEAILAAFEKIREQFGTTIVMVTHDRAIAARADREIVLHDGRIVS